jgi:hypothetical protein
MATSSGTRIAGRRGRTLFDADGEDDWVGWGDRVDSLAVGRVGVDDSDVRPMTEADENDCDTLALDGTVPSGPAPVCRGSRVGSEVAGGEISCVVVGWTGDGDGSADGLASDTNWLVVVGGGTSVDAGSAGGEVIPPYVQSGPSGIEGP